MGALWCENVSSHIPIIGYGGDVTTRSTVEGVISASRCRASPKRTAWEVFNPGGGSPSA